MLHKQFCPHKWVCQCILFVHHKVWWCAFDSMKHTNLIPTIIVHGSRVGCISSGPHMRGGIIVLSMTG